MQDPADRLSNILKWRVNKISGFCENPYFFPKQKLYPRQKELLKEFWYGGPKGIGYQELDLLKGMRGGGTFCAALIALDDAADILIRDDAAFEYGFASHSTIHILCVAKSEDQAADTIFKQITDKLKTSPFFNSFGMKIRKLDVTFRKNPDLIILAVGGASAGSASGRNVKCVVFDEISKYDDTKSQRGAWMVYSILSKSTATFGFGGHRVALSSCVHSKDIIMTLVEIAEQNPWALGQVIPTWEMNPNMPKDGEEMLNELKKDPKTFWRDYGCKPYAAYDAYYADLDIIRMDMDQVNLLQVAWDLWKANYDTITGELLPGGSAVNLTFDHRLVMAGDPSPKQDAFGICLMHKYKDKYIADGLFRLIPFDVKLEVNPIVIGNFLVWVVTHLPVRYFVTDIWNYPETLYKIRSKGCPVEQHHIKLEDYDKVKEDFYMHKLTLCKYPFIIKEFENLLITTGSKVNHVRGGSKDVVDALTNARWATDEMYNRPQRPMNVAVVR